MIKYDNVDDDHVDDNLDTDLDDNVDDDLDDDASPYLSALFAAAITPISNKQTHICSPPTPSLKILL